ncbi:MAG: hypothetical protein ACK4NA_09695 [Alphaproteobacteria bacterium]
MIPYGMAGSAMSPAAARALDLKGPVAPITPIARDDRRADSGRADAWIDASWSEAPARPAQIDPFDTDLAGAAFAAHRYAQDGMPAAAPAALQHRGVEAYRLAQGAPDQYRRGDLGIDLTV